LHGWIHFLAVQVPDLDGEAAAKTLQRVHTYPGIDKTAGTAAADDNTSTPISGWRARRTGQESVKRKPGRRKRQRQVVKPARADKVHSPGCQPGFSGLQVASDTPIEIAFNAANHNFGRDQVHAAGQGTRYVHA
jgi:hypothetical protein